MSIAKILITGATGFVGSHLLQAFMDIDHGDIQLVAACRDPAKLLPGYSGEVRVGDLRDSEYLDRLLVGIDIICHTAGWTNFLSNQLASNRQYLEPTLELFNHAIEWRVPRFVNLSSIAVAAVAHRNNAEIHGRPRRYNAMLNCMVAVEDYLRLNAARGCTVINLRAGIYSGRRLQRGVLPFLHASRRLPGVLGSYAYLPLVDGRDLAQAFVRAALAPQAAQFASFNILGPEIPTHRQLQHFLQQHGKASAINAGLPAFLSRPLYTMLSLSMLLSRAPLVTPTLSSLLHNPAMDNSQAIQQLGYDPQISWQASVQDWLQDNKTARHTESLLQARTQPLNLP